MPCVFRLFGYYVYFWSNEYQTRTILEPVHIHIAKRPSENGTKFWITSTGELVLAGRNVSRIPDNTLHKILSVLSSNTDVICSRWLSTFGSIRFIDTQ